MMPISQTVPPFTPDALEILFEKSNFKSFQKPGYMSHYWAPLISACSGMRRNEIFFLTPGDVVERDGIAVMCIPPQGSREMPAERASRDIPVHPTLKRLGFLAFVHERRQTHPNERLFSEYKAIQEQAGVLFSRAFVAWIKKTVTRLPENQKGLFADDFHFPSLRAFFFAEARRSGMNEDILQSLQGIVSGQRAVAEDQRRRNLAIAEKGMQGVDIESCFPPLVSYDALMA